MDKLFLTILNMSLTGTFVILVICLARLALKKSPKILSYCLWVLAGFRLVFPFSIESVLSLMPFKSTPIPTDIGMQAVPQIDSGVAIVDSTVNTILLAPPPDITASINPLQLWTTIGAYVWLLGVTVMLVYGVVSFFLLKRKLRQAIHSSANIYEANNIKSPFVLGMFIPKIYLPVGLSEQVKRYIILHEQTHIRRRDHMIKFAAFFILCLHWFNPLVWAAFRLMSTDMEMSCDECVLKEMGDEGRKDYSLALLLLATEQHVVSGSPLAFGEGSVKVRVKNILNFKQSSRLFITLAIVLVVVLSALFAVDKASNLGHAVYKDGTEYILKHGKALNNTVLSDGIRLRLLSAYKDEGSVSLFFSVTDEDDDRLNEMTTCLIDINDTFSSSRMELTEYDKESKTATFFLSYDLTPSETIGEEITFTLSHLSTGEYVREWESYQQEGLDPYQIVKDHTAEMKNTTFFDLYDAFHLKGNQLNIPLKGFSEDLVHFSNAGFIDGKLHLQVANTDRIKADRKRSRIQTLYLIDKNGNEIGKAATGRLPEETDEIRVLSFYEDGCTFKEFIFPEITDVNDLRGTKIVAEGENYVRLFNGNWQTTFTLPADGNNLTIPVTKEIFLGKRKVNAHKVTISPLSVKVYYDGFYLPNGDWYSAFSDFALPGQTFPEDEVFITYKDGTKVILDWCGFQNDMPDIGTIASENFSTQLTDPFEVIELKEVKSITIYGQEFSPVSP